LVAANLLAETLETPDLLAEIARDVRAIRAVLYAAAGRHGRVFGTGDVFPAPFDPKICAPYLLATYKRLRRVMTVGDSLDNMSQLRELLAQSRCSTAVAFDPRQAFDLISLVRPEYVLIDLSMPAGGGFELLVDLSKRSDPAPNVGLTWSRPLDAATVRSELGKRCGHENFDPVRLASQIAVLLEADPARS
jgi:CheY-like chemotaxis protein